MNVEHYEPVWNGAMEASGHVPGLSTYTGPSTLASVQPHRKAKAEGLIITHAIAIGPQPTAAEVRAYLKCGFSIRRAAQRFRCSQRLIRSLRDADRAVQGALFEERA